MKRAKSSYINLRKKRYINESIGVKNQSININNYKEISIENYYVLDQYPKEPLSSTTKDYGINPNDYASKHSNQLKRKKMFKELWSQKSKSKNNIFLLDTIKIQRKYKKNNYNNIVGHLKGVPKKKRIASAGTFCNFPLKEKEESILSHNKYNSSININSSKKYNTKNFSNKINFKIYSDLNSNSKTKSNSANIKSKDKFINESSNIIFHNKELQNCLSPINPDFNSVMNFTNSNVLMNNKEETEKNETDSINKFLENSTAQNNYEKNPEILKLRMEYLIKFSKINDLFKKLAQVTDCFRVNFREMYNSGIKSLIRIFDFCNNYLLNEVKIGENIDINILSSIYQNIYKLCLQISKIQKFFFVELHYLSNENLNLKQKLNLQETELNQKNKEINEINKLINKYDLNSKVKIGKKLEFNVGKIKQKFTNQESSYVLTIYKLEEEIKNLTELLKQKKPDLTSQDKMKEKLKLLERQYEEEMGRISRSNIEKDMNLKLVLHRNSSLNDKISELENEIMCLKNKEEKDEENKIYYQAKIENLNKVIEKNKEIIESLKKENENYKQIKNKENISVKTSKIIFMSPK